MKERSKRAKANRPDPSRAYTTRTVTSEVEKGTQSRFEQCQRLCDQSRQAIQSSHDAPTIVAQLLHDALHIDCDEMSLRFRCSMFAKQSTPSNRTTTAQYNNPLLATPIKIGDRPIASVMGDLAYELEAASPPWVPPLETIV